MSKQYDSLVGKQEIYSLKSKSYKYIRDEKITAKDAYEKMNAQHMKNIPFEIDTFYKIGDEEIFVEERVSLRLSGNKKYVKNSINKMKISVRSFLKGNFARLIIGENVCKNNIKKYIQNNVINNIVSEKYIHLLNDKSFDNEDIKEELTEFEKYLQYQLNKTLTTYKKGVIK